MTRFLLNIPDGSVLTSDEAKFIEKYYVKQGEWKRISMDKYIRHASHFYRCSVCGEDTIGETNFCPNCGADMRKEGDEK